MLYEFVTKFYFICLAQTMIWLIEVTHQRLLFHGEPST